MSDNNNQNLDKTVIETFSELDVSITDIVASTRLIIKSSSTNTSQSNQGLNAETNSNETITIKNSKQTGSGKFQAKSIGTPAKGGKFTTANTKQLPNVFFNFRKKTFTNYKDLLFKFETSNLNASDFTGTKLSTWYANTNVSSISLTNASNPLSVVKAYGKYFYQLDRTTNISDKSISNIVSLPIKTNPSYTIFVFGVGSQGSHLGGEISRANVLHTFCDSTNTNDSSKNYKNYNIGQIQKYLSGGTSWADSDKSYTSNPTANFVGNTLNSNKYTASGMLEASTLYKKYINIYDKDFSTRLDDDDYGNLGINHFARFIGNYTDENKYSLLCSSNIGPFVLNTIPGANPPGNVVPMTLNPFSLHFVEMFSYIEGTYQDYNILRLQTFVDGYLTFDGRTLLKKNIPIESDGTFKIKLSNDYVSSKNGGNAYAGTKLFLFDYMHGISNSSVSTMKQTSRNIVESLVYDYRSLILKSTTDIQLSSSASTTTLLPSPPALIHPFLKMFFN